MNAATPDIAIARSAVFRTVNAVGHSLGWLGVNSFRLNADVILKKARQQAGYKGPLPGHVEEGVNRLVESILNEGRPNPFAKLALNNLLTRTIYGRLMLEQAMAEDPAIEEAPIPSPVFILGMPRTGSSILHALLHQDPAHRAPLAWECLHPWPVSTPETFKDNPGLRTTRKEFGQLFELVPDFKRKHFMEADEPQECIGIDFLDLNSFQPSAQLYAPSYMKWAEHDSNRTETMRFHKRFLQWLQSGGVKAERWLLKTPVHMMRLPELLEVYPDACIIATHRDPKKVLPSAASLISSVRSLYSNSEDPVQTGREQLETWSMYLERFLEARRNIKRPSQMVDIHFDDFVADQMAVVRRVYAHFGWVLTEETEARMKAFLKKNPKGKHGAHNYALSDFGLTDEDVETRFDGYDSFLADIKTP